MCQENVESLVFMELCEDEHLYINKRRQKTLYILFMCNSRTEDCGKVQVIYKVTDLRRRILIIN